MQAVPQYFSSILAETPVDQSTSEISYSEYRTSDINIHSNTSQSTEYYQIVVKDSDEWLLMSQAYLQVRAQIVDANDAVTVAQPITLAAAGASLFSRMELMANDTQIDICENPQFVELMNALLYYNKDKIASVADSEWLQLDSYNVVNAAAGNAADPLSLLSTEFVGAANTVRDTYGGGAALRQYVRALAATAANVGAESPNFNGGFALRWNKTRAGREFEIIIPLSSVFGFCRDIKSVHRGLKWELNLQKNIRYASILHGGAALTAANADPGYPAPVGNFKTLLKKISLWVPKVVPSLEMVKLLEASLNKDVVSKQYFENMTCRFSETYGTGTRDVEWLLSLEGHRLVKAVFGFQRYDQFNSQNDLTAPPAVYGLAANSPQSANQLIYLNSQSHANPALFSHLGAAWGTGEAGQQGLPQTGAGGIVEAELVVNNRSLPREKYKVKFDINAPEYDRPYVDLLKLSDRWQSDEGSIITRDNYREFYPLFGFDLRDYQDIFSGLTDRNDVRFKARIQNGSEVPFRVVAVLYTERELIVQPIQGKLSLKV